jgi:phosphate:Na+ symporter
MSFSITLVELAGAIALLLWGTHMVQTGVQRAFGAGLRMFLRSTLRNRLAGFAAGVVVTALLQSSTATGLMLTNFSAGGLVDLVPALGVMLGANVGTTLIVQVFAFDIAIASPALILVGYLLFRRDASTRAHDLGRVLIGLGLMVLALTQLLQLMTSYEDTPSLRLLLGAVATTPILDVLLAAGLTWAAHSSVAIVLLVVSLASRGVVPPDAAFALVLGANLGTAINPLVEGISGNDPAGKRLPLGNLVTRLVGVGVALALLEPIGSLLVAVEPNNARAVADFHTLFNLAVAVLFLPVLGPYAALLRRWLPARADPADPSRPLYLDPAALETPIIAIGAAAREALRLVDVLADMLAGARNIIASDNRRLMAETKRRDDILDSLNTAVKQYLASIDPDDLGEAEQRRLAHVLAFTMNIEQAGDVVDRNLLPHAAKRLKRGLSFSPGEQADLTRMLDRLLGNLKTAASLFMTEDPGVAHRLADEKVVFREAEASGMAAHLLRLRSGHLATAQASALQVDLLRDLKQINSHIVAAAAYPLLERSGRLLASRIAEGD